MRLALFIRHLNFRLTYSLETQLNHLLPANLSAGHPDAFLAIADDIYQQGFSIQHDILPPHLSNELSVFARQSASFDRAGIGRDTDFHQNKFVRTDEISWIQGNTAVTAAWLNWMDCLKNYLNQRLLLGLFSYESHFAHYPPGSFYKRHLDAFQGESNRVLSTVLYLNSGWANGNGGELVIYPDEDDASAIKVTPLMGTLVVFLSEEFPHEVLPANRDRFSIAGWFRVNNSTAKRVDPPR